MTDDRHHYIRVALRRVGGGIGFSLRGHPLTSCVASLVVCVTAAAVVLGSIRIEGAQSSAVSDQHANQQATLAGAVSLLAASMEDEQTDLAVYVGAGRPSAKYALLFAQGQETTTEDVATQVVSLAGRSGLGLVPQFRAVAGELPALRREAVDTQTPALNVIEGYSQAISGLLAFDAQIASGSGDAVYVRDVSAFSALQKAGEAAAQERAILGAALAAGKWQPGELSALSAAEQQRQTALSEFGGQATSSQQQAYQNTVSGPDVGESDQMLEQALVSGANGALGVTAPAGAGFTTVAGIQGAWNQAMTFTVDQMRLAERNLLSQIQARGQALHAQATRTLLETWLEMAVVVLAVVAFAVGVTRRRRSRTLVR
jgi:outer membrane murein-binding lipoprotein Lpp